MWRHYVDLAIRNIRHRKLRSWLTMIGIFIGIAAVVSLISLGSGLREAIIVQFGSVGADKITITPKSAAFGPPGSFSSVTLDSDDLQAIRDVKGVQLATGRILVPAKIKYEDETIFTYAVSLPPDTEARQVILESLNMDIAEGRMVRDGDGLAVVLGSNVANAQFNEPVEVRKTLTVNGRDMQVKGILEDTGNFQIDDSLILMEDTLKEVFDIDDQYDVIVAQVADGADVPSVSADIEKALRDVRHVEEGKEDFEVSTPQETINSLNDIILIVNAVLVGIAGISLLVGGIGVMNTMYTAVLQRTREIGVMKAIGAKNANIVQLFLIESGMLGMAGGVIGLILGIGLSKGVALIGAQVLGSALLQASISLELVLGSLVFSFLIGMISGAWPAKQAANLNPVDALRYE